MRSMSRDFGRIVAQPSSIQDQILEQSAQGSYSSFLFASTGVSSGSTRQDFRGTRHRRESPSVIRSSEEPRSRQVVSSETLKERLRRETIEALDREWERGALPDEDLRGRENVDSRSDSSTGKSKTNQRKIVWRISKVEIYQVDKPVPQTAQLTDTAMDLSNSPPILDGELADGSCTEPSSEQEQDIGQDSDLNEERTYAWNISTAHELHKYVSGASSSCDEKSLNRLIHYEGRNENVADPFRSPNFGYLHQRHVDRGKQDAALEFIQTFDCGHNIRSNRTFLPNQIVTQDTNQENVLVPTYQENIPHRCDNSVDRLSKVRGMTREKVSVC